MIIFSKYRQGMATNQNFLSLFLGNDPYERLNSTSQLTDSVNTDGVSHGVGRWEAKHANHHQSAENVKLRLLPHIYDVLVLPWCMTLAVVFWKDTRMDDGILCQGEASQRLLGEFCADHPMDDGHEWLFDISIAIIASHTLLAINSFQSSFAQQNTFENKESFIIVRTISDETWFTG